MGPYSHYILAAKLEESLQPELPQAYYWGAVVPDIRYLANMRRDHTHLGPDRFNELMSCYPNLRSFLLGYQVHILIDQMDVSQIINAAFPINLLKMVLRKNISPQQIIMLVEMYYLQSGTAGPLSGDHNEVLADLGITSQQTSVFRQALQEYFDNRTSEAAIAAFQKIGWIQNARVEKYLNAYLTMQKRKVMNTLLMISIRNARLDSRAIEHVHSCMAG